MLDNWMATPLTVYTRAGNTSSLRQSCLLLRGPGDWRLPARRKYWRRASWSWEEIALGGWIWRIDHFVHYCSLYTPLVGHFDAPIQVQTGCFRTGKPKHLITKQVLLFRGMYVSRSSPGPAQGADGKWREAYRWGNLTLIRPHLAVVLGQHLLELNYPSHLSPRTLYKLELAGQKSPHHRTALDMADISDGGDSDADPFHISISPFFEQLKHRFISHNLQINSYYSIRLFPHV